MNHSDICYLFLIYAVIHICVAQILIFTIKKSNYKILNKILLYILFLIVPYMMWKSILCNPMAKVLVENIEDDNECNNHKWIKTSNSRVCEHCGKVTEHFKI